MDSRKHLQNMFEKGDKTISLSRRQQDNLPRAALVAIYKSFVRPDLDFGDIICDQIFNTFFMKGSNQFNIMQHLP